MSAGFITLPEWMFFGVAGIALIAGAAAFVLAMTLWGNPLIKMILKAKRPATGSR